MVVLRIRMYSKYTTVVLLVVACLTFFLCFCEDLKFVGNYFVKLDGYRMNTSTSEIFTLVNTEHEVSKCAAHCSVDPHCKSFSVSNYNESYTCIFMSKGVWDMSVSWLTDPDWTTWTLVTESATHNDWTLVFRGTPGIESPIYEAFMGISQDGHFEPGCLRLDNALPCHSHFRSAALDEWSKISKIRLSLYKDGIEQQHIVFDAFGTTIETWFRKTTLIGEETSWPGLEYLMYQYFNLEGDYKLDLVKFRRFYINMNRDGCSKDKGYLVIIDTPMDDCGWVNSSTQPTYPWILYSGSDMFTKWSDKEYAVADIFAISVQFYQ